MPIKLDSVSERARCNLSRQMKELVDVWLRSNAGEETVEFAQFCNALSWASGVLGECENDTEPPKHVLPQPMKLKDLKKNGLGNRIAG